MREGGPSRRAGCVQSNTSITTVPMSLPSTAPPHSASASACSSRSCSRPWRGISTVALDRGGECRRLGVVRRAVDAARGDHRMGRRGARRQQWRLQPQSLDPRPGTQARSRRRGAGAGFPRRMGTTGAARGRRCEAPGLRGTVRGIAGRRAADRLLRHGPLSARVRCKVEATRHLLVCKHFNGGRSARRGGGRSRRRRGPRHGSGRASRVF